MKKQKQLKNIRNVVPVLCLFGILLPGCGQSGGGSASTGSGDYMCSASLASAAPSSFFQDVDEGSSQPVEEQVPHSIRRRAVAVNIEALKQAIQRPPADGLPLDLFNDKSLKIKVEGIQKISDTNVVMVGHIEGQENSDVSLVINDNVLVAEIRPDEGTHYKIEYQGEDIHAIYETDSEDENCDAVQAPVVENDQPMIGEDDGGGENHATATSTIDMLVAYTPRARSKVGGTSAMKAKIQLGIADTNKAFQNSGVNLQVRLVGTKEMTQNDTNNFSSDLSSLRGKSDGRWDSVHAERTRVGADQVTLIGVYSGNGTAGIGYIKAGYSSAFTVVKYSSFGSYSFTHELGHNVGLNHSDGYVNSGGRFRTVMAYGSYPRIRRFSNPSITYNSYRTGDSNQNSASILNSYGGGLAKLVAVRVPYSAADGTFAAPDPSAPVTCAGAEEAEPPTESE